MLASPPQKAGFFTIGGQKQPSVPKLCAPPAPKGLSPMPRITRAVIALGASVALALTIPGVATAAPTNPNAVTATDISTALDRTDAQNGKLIADAQPSAADNDSTAQTTNVDIPSDPNRGVELRTDTGQSLTIRLPGASQSGKGVKTRRGAVAYSGNDGSANAVIPTADGVQLLTTIKHRKAPLRYTYPISVPQGGKIDVRPDGSAAAILDATGKPLAIIAPSWGRDAKGKVVGTKFATDDGRSLTQIVSHRTRAVAYPVVVDPQLVWGWYKVDIRMNRSETNKLMFGATLASIALGLGLPQPFGAIVGALGGSYVAYANWAYNTGGCMAFTVTYWWAIYAWHYYGGNCR